MEPGKKIRKTRVNIILGRDHLAMIDMAALSVGMSRSDFVVKGSLALAGQAQRLETPSDRICRAAAVLAEASSKALGIMSGEQ